MKNAVQIIDTVLVKLNGAGRKELMRELQIKGYMCPTCERLLAAGAKCPSGHPTYFETAPGIRA